MALHEQHVIELFNDSLERCRHTPHFLDVFYDRLLAASPEIPALFAGTDFRRQKRLLTMALYVLLAAAEGYPEGMNLIGDLAKSHAKRGIPPAMYDMWLICLVEAVGVCDPRYSAEIGDAWRQILAPGIQVMRSQAVPPAE